MSKPVPIPETKNNEPDFNEITRRQKEDLDRKWAEFDRGVQQANEERNRESAAAQNEYMKKAVPGGGR